MSMKFNVDGEIYELDIEKLTFAEARAFEAHSGVSFMDAIDNPNLRAGIDALQAIVWIAVKRKEPTTKFSDLDDLEISSIVTEDEEDEDSESGGDEPADPTEPADVEESRRAAIAVAS